MKQGITGVPYIRLSQVIIHKIFPEPVYISKLERALTKKELEIVSEYKRKTKKNVGNNRTKDSYVLEHKSLKNLKKDLTKMVIDYFNKVVGTDNSIIPYITQSWINYSEANQFHASHYHYNSYISGIFYISAKKEVDNLVFNRSVQKQLSLKIAQTNEFNSMTAGFFIQSGDVVLFPSTLRHEVPPKKGTNIRISLAFNVFFKGTIGNKINLTELVIE